MVKIFTKRDYNPPDLLQSGISHINSAELLLKADPFMFDSAGYLAHMGLELMLKSWILHETGEFKGIHALQDLTNVICTHDSNVSFTAREKKTLTYLSRFEELRYPNRQNPIEVGAEDIEQILEFAESIWQQLPNNLVSDLEKIENYKKGGRVLMYRSSKVSRDLKFEAGIEKNQTH